ncbi:hypothetical protein Q7F20_15180 [Curtobacterium sp. A7_M15]|uniref:hypothetical protein n=1 Tax=Curtobacterium sp. A7_M15 TaxID=3065241 RepID=UPI002737CD5F|nr:hypothetical protein [Curtobacterium sp. A7_M15]MDP4334718.1 hypothetical protein [Curtobacterium sp. A7_M15]
METQSGARTPLVDPFGRELEEWLRDAPATRAPYLSDLVVPPVTGPVQRPAAASDAPVEPATTSRAAVVVDDAAFRRPRDRARHAAACAPSFPEPPERIALRIEDLAVEVSSASGRSTIERIVILEDEVRRRDEDLARLAAWEATVAGQRDPEVEAARAFAHSVFADLLADAALEADRRDRAAARRAATGSVSITAVSAAAPVSTATPAPAVIAATAPAPALVDAAEVVDAIDALEATTPGLGDAVRPVLSLPVVSPVSANTRPTPLVQPATGPTVIDRAAFAAALTAHAGATASTPVVLPEAVAPIATTERPAQAVEVAPEDRAAAGWWSRLVARIMRAFGRR